MANKTEFLHLVYNDFRGIVNNPMAVGHSLEFSEMQNMVNDRGVLKLRGGLGNPSALCKTAGGTMFNPTKGGFYHNGSNKWFLGGSDSLLYRVAEGATANAVSVIQDTPGYWSTTTTTTNRIKPWLRTALTGGLDGYSFIRMWRISDTCVFATLHKYIPGIGTNLYKVAQFNGTAWVDLGFTSSGGEITGLWVYDATNVFVIDNDAAVRIGTISKWDGSVWTSVSIPAVGPTTGSLTGISGISPTKIYLVKGGGGWTPECLLSFDGASFTLLYSDSLNTLRISYIKAISATEIYLGALITPASYYDVYKWDGGSLSVFHTDSYTTGYFNIVGASNIWSKTYLSTGGTSWWDGTTRRIYYNSANGFVTFTPGGDKFIQYVNTFEKYDSIALDFVPITFEDGYAPVGINGILELNEMGDDTVYTYTDTATVWVPAVINYHVTYKICGVANDSNTIILAEKTGVYGTPVVDSVGNVSSVAWFSPGKGLYRMGLMTGGTYGSSPTYWHKYWLDLNPLVSDYIVVGGIDSKIIDFGSMTGQEDIIFLKDDGRIYRWSGTLSTHGTLYVVSENVGSPLPYSLQRTNFGLVYATINGLWVYTGGAAPLCLTPSFGYNAPLFSGINTSRLWEISSGFNVRDEEYWISFPLTDGTWVTYIYSFKSKNLYTFYSPYFAGGSFFSKGDHFYIGLNEITDVGAPSPPGLYEIGVHAADPGTSSFAAKLTSAWIDLPGARSEEFAINSCSITGVGWNTLRIEYGMDSLLDYWPGPDSSDTHSVSGQTNPDIQIGLNRIKKFRFILEGSKGMDSPELTEICFRTNIERQQ